VNVRLGIAVVLALLAGLVVGRLGPQDELRQLKAQVDAQQRELAGRPRAGGGPMLAGVRSMFNVPRPDPDAGAGAPRPRAAVTAEAPPAAGPDRPRRRSSLSNQVARLKETWQLRSAIAHSNLVARVGLNAQQVEQFDATLDAMNFRLGDVIDQRVAQLRQAGGLTPESGFRMVSDLSAVMLMVYDDLDQVLPPGWREQAGPRFDPVSFVDPEVLTPLQEAESLLPPPASRE